MVGFNSRVSFSATEISTANNNVHLTDVRIYPGFIWDDQECRVAMDTFNLYIMHLIINFVFSF